MSFWTTTSGEAITKDSEVSTGFDNTPIPEGTVVKAILTETTLKEYEGEQYVNYRWDIVAPADYKGRVIFQKLNIYNEKESKRNNARIMLMQSYNIAGKTPPASAPNEDDLYPLQNMSALLKLGVWDFTKEGGKSGNWVQEIKSAKQQQAPQQQQAPAQARQPDFDDFDDNIPF